jgi:anti-sigma factor ChrR (cupin superfamily)
MLVEAGPGAVIPKHVQGGVEWGLVLEGTMEDEEGVVSAGNFVYRPAGSRHSVRMPNGAKYIGFFHGSARMNRYRSIVSQLRRLTVVVHFSLRISRWVC